MGESCTHIGSLLFKIEAAVRSGFTKRACTEEACKWNVDFVKKLQPVPIYDVNFYTHQAINKYKNNKTKFNSFPATSTKSTSEEENVFLTELAASQRQPIILHTFSDYCQQFIPKFVPPSRAAIPPSLRGLFSSQNSEIVSDEMDALVKTTMEKIEVSAATIDYIYNVTKKQSKSTIWHEMRTGRITASVAHDVLHTNMENPSKSLILRICQESKLKTTKVPSLRWGIDHEKVALEEYKLLLSTEHTHYEIKDCGLRLCLELPFIGASPDGIFMCTCHDYQYIIEIKCPYSMRDTDSLEDAIQCTQFFIDKEKHLKNGHRYYTQIQLQLFVFDMDKCELVVWTPTWLYHTTIHRDITFINSTSP